MAKYIGIYAQGILHKIECNNNSGCTTLVWYLVVIIFGFLVSNMAEVSLEDFLKEYDYNSEGINRMVHEGLLYGNNHCCNNQMKLVLKRGRWTWQCGSCASTKSILRQSFFEVWSFTIQAVYTCT